jgi:hypothetical protein
MDACATVNRKTVGAGILQTRLDGTPHFTARNLQLRDGFTHIAQTGCRLFQPFGGIGHSPSPEPAGRSLKRVGRRSCMGRLGAYDPFQHQHDLPRENLQNLSLEALIAQRHPFEVALIEDPVSQLRAKIGRPPRLCHDILSPPIFFRLSCPALSFEWSSESRVNRAAGYRNGAVWFRIDGE